MANNLPDEIISEILSPALKVPEDEFSDSSPVSPFARYSESSSAFLLVSKAWLRVSTPLLYHVVVLRSTAQAKALHVALSQNAQLGRFIKKLRVEGGYGGSMLKIINAAPNVTDLFISLNIWSSDNISGLSRGLPLMNPTRVVLHDPPNRNAHNKNSMQLIDTLVQCIKAWTNLTIFEIPFSNYLYYHSTPSMGISTALSQAPNLKTLVIPNSRFGAHAPPPHLQLIAKNPSLQRIQFKERTGGRVSPDLYKSNCVTHPSLRGLIKVPADDAIILPPTPVALKPRPKSIQFSTTSVTEEIWNRVLYFAMALDVDIARTWSGAKSRLGIVLVSKMFARLALPYLNEAVLFKNSITFTLFLNNVVFSTTNLALQVRTIYFDTSAHINLRPILPKTKLVDIIGLTPFSVTLKGFSDLGKFSGSTLVRLEGIQVAKAAKLESPAIFSLFPHLRSLSMGFRPSFNETSVIPSAALPALEQLTLSSFDESLMTVLSQMDLAALRHVAVPAEHRGLGPFFGKHGSKLQTLTVSSECLRRIDIFDLCTALADLTVDCGKSIPDPGRFISGADHTSLETITFQTDGRQRGAERKWATFFNSLSVSTFPALRQISVPCIKWPTTEHAISKSLWAKWAEALLDHDVKLIDAKGVGWRRRLQK
ncbi:hypothetical protein C8R44DRAFT_770194 [Mycena epipterygia]|nr:hypothetical protein C8R44DRAFT_770194 [Mycena epipterygia]